MPTKRFCTSSVSTTSPEVLVVAGGYGYDSNLKKLYVVEVLHGDKWLMVDHLPAPAYGMPSTFHDGKICFMKRWNQEDGAVFTCSCTSLISSCSKSSGNSSTDRPLWRQFQAPGGSRGTIASCYLRLILIDGRGTVRGYSSVTRSWLKATSTGQYYSRPGEIIDYYGQTAATVLSTGELILAHQLDGVYRGAVSGEREDRYGRGCVYVCYLEIFIYRLDK